MDRSEMCRFFEDFRCVFVDGKMVDLPITEAHILETGWSTMNPSDFWRDISYLMNLPEALRNGTAVTV